MAPSFRTEQVRLSAVIAVGIAVGVGVWLGTRSSNGHGAAARAPTGVTGAQKQVVPIDTQGLQTLVSTLKRPIYWAGEVAHTTMELTQLPDGRVYVRYLPPGVKIGSPQAELTVGTYQVADALADVERSARAPKAVRISTRGGGIAFYTRDRPTNVYVAFPGLAYEIEVFDPDAARAKSLVQSGKIAPVPTFVAPSVGTRAKLVSVADLTAAAKSQSHPVYWAGPRTGSVYELSQPTGRFYVRYLPPGTKAGTSVAALTVGTYSVSNAFAVVQRLAGRPGSVQVPVTGGAIAFSAKSAPASVYVAFPGKDVEVEVYDPSPGGARQLVTSGKIVPLH